MLKDKQVARKITSIAVAENLKKEDLSTTANRLLSCGEDQNFADMTKEFLSDPDARLYEKIGFTITMPFSIVLAGLVKMGTMSYAYISQMREENTIQSLIDEGIITEEQVPEFLERVNELSEEKEKIFDYVGENYMEEMGRSL